MKVDKLSVSLDPELRDAVRRSAGPNGNLAWPRTVPPRERPRSRRSGASGNRPRRSRHDCQAARCPGTRDRVAHPPNGRRPGLAGSAGRQANLARLLRAVDVRAIDHQDGRQAGVLLGQASAADPIDACVVLLAEPGDRILTSDPDDLTRLATAAANRAVVINC
jgi:hypothetical protein